MLPNYLLYQTCRILRPKESVDEYGTPINNPYPYDEVEKCPCRLSKDRLSFTQGQPATEVSNSYTLYLQPNVDIKAGDIAEVEGVKYRCGEPYRPGLHHTEVTVSFEGEI